MVRHRATRHERAFPAIHAHWALAFLQAAALPCRWELKSRPRLLPLPHQVQGRCAAATLHALNQSKEVQALPHTELEAHDRRHCIAAQPEEGHPTTAGATLRVVVDARLVQKRDLLALLKLRLIFLFGYGEAAQALKVLVVLIVGCIL